MTHITFSTKTLSKPSLEFFSDGAHEPRRVTIEKCPFKIGRAESSDLRVDSVQVSREHAEIVDRGGVWFLRDLGSTNGTHVNGKRVTEAMLADGDILKIAESELTFVASAATKFQRMATQPIHARDRAIAPLAIPPEVMAARTISEATLWQAIPLQLVSLASLQGSADVVLFASAATGDGPINSPPLFRMNHRASHCYRELFRRRAVEAAKRYDAATRLFIAVDSAELESSHQLLTSLEAVLEQLPAGLELGLTVSAPAVLETARVGEFYQALRNQGLLIAYEEFQGNGGQVAQFDSCVPDYLLLSENMTKGLSSSGDARQPVRRLESVLAACEESAVSVVLPLGDCEQTLDACRQLGYDLVLRKTPLAPMAIERTMQGEIESR